MPERRLFLERRGYRMRRIMDVVRLWPLVGLVLWMVPLMWPLPEAPVDPVPISVALRYLFGVWVILILGATVLWWHTGRAGQGSDDPAETPAGDDDAGARGG